MTYHGTTRGYTYYRCRCDRCKQAAANYRKQWRENKGQQKSNKHHWPIQPLFDAAGTNDCIELAYLTGFSPRSIHRWKNNGVPDVNADRAACKLGLHPYTIWPEWFDPYLQGAA